MRFVVTVPVHIFHKNIMWHITVRPLHFPQVWVRMSRCHSRHCTDPLDPVRWPWGSWLRRMIPWWPWRPSTRVAWRAALNPSSVACTVYYGGTTGARPSLVPSLLRLTKWLCEWAMWGSSPGQARRQVENIWAVCRSSPGHPHSQVKIEGLGGGRHHDTLAKYRGCGVVSETTSQSGKI